MKRPYGGLRGHPGRSVKEEGDEESYSHVFTRHQYADLDFLPSEMLWALDLVLQGVSMEVKSSEAMSDIAHTSCRVVIMLFHHLLLYLPPLLAAPLNAKGLAKKFVFPRKIAKFTFSEAELSRRRSRTLE